MTSLVNKSPDSRRKLNEPKIAHVTKQRAEGLEQGTDRVMRSVYLDLSMLKRLRLIANSTERSVQEVMREGLLLVVAKHAKGSVRE